MVFIRSARKNGRSAFCVNKGLPISIEPFTAYSHSKIGPSAISAAIRSPGANVLLNPFIYYVAILIKTFDWGGIIASSKYISPKESSSIIKIDITPIVL